MHEVPLTNTSIAKIAQSLRAEAVNRLNEEIEPPSSVINIPSPKSPKQQRQSKRNEALLTSSVLTIVVALSTLIHPLDWRLAVGCVSAGSIMAIGGLLEKRGYVGLMMLLLLASMGLGVLSMMLFGTKGPMLWIQSMPLIGIGAFGFAYIFFEQIFISKSA
jgi:hypothetical protein